MESKVIVRFMNIYSVRLYSRKYIDNTLAYSSAAVLLL